jgi:hypothetical protein
MMRGIYLTVAKSYRLVCMVWLTGTLRRGYCERSFLAKTVSCRDGDLTSGHKSPRVSSDHGHWHACNGCPSQKQDQSDPQPGRSRRPIQNPARDLRFFR